MATTRKKSTPPAQSLLFMARKLSVDTTVPTDSTLLVHDLIIEDGIELTIEDGGEVLHV